MAGRRLTEEHIDVIVELGELGKSDQFIANVLKARFGLTISPSAISWHRLRHCAEPDTRVAIREVPVEPIVQRRGDHVVRRFTQAEDRLLVRMVMEGLSDTAIARELGRKANSIRGRLMTLARHETRRDRAEIAS